MQQAQAGDARERQAAAQAQEQKLEEILKRAQQLPKPTPQPVRVVTKTPLPAAKSAPVAADPPVPHDAGVKVRILRSDKAASFAGPPPAANRGDVAYLPAGSFAHARVITGAIATSRAGGALPVLFSAVGPFQPPWQLQGPGVFPVRTEMPAQGCFVLGKAQADLGANRVLVQVDLLSCVMPDAATFEVPIRGYVVDVDGSLGMVGRLETHDSAVLAKTFLTSLLAGAAESFKLAKQSSITTPLGGTITTQQGQYGEAAGFAALANASAQLSQFYLSQASQLLPTLALDAGQAARVVLQEGVSFDGFPLTTTLVKGR
jgi:conjugal transfer pilus assembly protein TraB